MNSSKNCSNAFVRGIRPGIILSRKFILIVTTLTGIFIFYACGQGYEKQKAIEARAEADALLGSQSAIVTDTINGVAHNFIRNASLKFKVKDVMSATKNIEDLVAKHGGYVANSDFSSVISHNNSVQIKKDSLLELSWYNTTNFITMRIPTKKLDTVLRSISDLALFIDYRKLSSDDVKLKLAANKLAEARLFQFSDRIAEKTTSKNTKVNHVVSAQSNVLEKQQLADEKRIESYELTDQVNYSTVTLELYQEQRISSQMLAKPVDHQPYVTPFIYKLGGAFMNGFELLKNCILFFIDSWGLILILVGIFFAVRKMIRGSKSSEVVMK